MDRFYSTGKKGKLERNSKELAKGAGQDEKTGFDNFRGICVFVQDWRSLHSWCFHSPSLCGTFIFSCLYLLSNRVKEDTCTEKVLNRELDPSSSLLRVF